MLEVDDCGIRSLGQRVEDSRSTGSGFESLHPAKFQSCGEILEEECQLDPDHRPTSLPLHLLPLCVLVPGLGSSQHHHAGLWEGFLFESCATDLVHF